MQAVVRVLKTIWNAITWPIRLIRESESDLQETYPDHYKPTGPESATQGSVTSGFIGGGIS